MGTKFFSDELPVHKTTVDGWTTNIINGLLGQANGIAPLGVDGLVDPAYLPPTALNTSWGNIGGTITDQADLMTLIGAKAGLASPAFTGTPTAPTAPDGDSSLQIANTEFVRKAINTRGYNVTSAVYENKSFSVATQSGDMKDMILSPDGTMFFIIDSADNAIHRFGVKFGGEPFEVTEIEYWDSVVLTGQSTVPYGLQIKPDGTKLYVGAPAQDKIFQYSMTTPWDLATLVYDNVFLDISAQIATVGSVNFRDDGLKMVLLNEANETLYQYTLSTAWDVSTATYDNVSLSIYSVSTSCTLCVFAPDGYTFWINHTGTQSLYQFDLTSPWDISTASYNGYHKKFYPNVLTGFTAMAFGKNGRNMYIAGTSNDTIYQYVLP